MSGSGARLRRLPEETGDEPSKAMQLLRQYVGSAGPGLLVKGSSLISECTSTEPEGTTSRAFKSTTSTRLEDAATVSS